VPGVLADGLALLFGRLFSPATTNMTAIAQSFYMEVDVHRYRVYHRSRQSLLDL
jgi:hypothetical protein